MSGTGHFRDAGQPRAARGGRLGAWSLIAREHLGDRLAAYVDGELDGDARERVLSHLATCDPCRGQAEEQRRLKSAMADALPPALSAGLLARLQCLPGCDPDDLSGPGPDTPFGLFGRSGPGLPGGGRDGGRASFLAPADGSGFAIHEIGRPAASRGRRLAFAAAGAFSLAALAIGAALPLETVPASVPGAAEPATGSMPSPLGMRQVADQRSAAAFPAPAADVRAVPSAQGGRSALGVTGSAAPVPPGTPSALPLAAWRVGGAARADSAGRSPVAAAPRAAAPAASRSAAASPPATSGPPRAHGAPVAPPAAARPAVPHLPHPPSGGHPY